MSGDVPRTKLSELVDRIGVGLGDEPRRCDSLLAEACGTAYRDECAALVAAVVHGVTGELQRSSSAPRGTLLDRLSRQLAADAGLSAYLARWSVECWAVALRVVPKNDRLLIVKLDGLARLLDEAAAVGPIGMADLDRFVAEAARRGIDEGDARAYLISRLARCFPPAPAEADAAAHLPDPEPRTEAASAAAPTIASGPEIADKPLPSAAADASAPTPNIVPLRVRGRRQRWPRILGWGAGLVVAAITAGVFVDAMQQHGAMQPPPIREVPQASRLEVARAEAEAERHRQEVERQRLETEAVERGGRQAALAAQQRRQAEAAERAREQAAAEKQRQQAELATREQRTYIAARGSRTALDEYASTCVLCAFAPDARAEIRRLEGVEEDERMYRQSRGNLYALQAYVKVCDVCAFKSAANEEITKLEAPTPDIKGIVTLAPKSDWIMVGGQWVHLFGISDGPVYDRSHESYMRRYLEPANGSVECFVRSARRYQCFAAGKDIALQALSDGVATPEPGAPGAYVAASAQH